MKNIRLSPEEKILMKQEIFDRTGALNYGPAKAPAITWWTVIFANRRLAYSLAGVLIFSLSGASAALAAEGAIPGDILYPLKVSLTEPIRDKIKRTSEEKARWEVEKISRRLNEAEILAVRGELDTENRTQIEKRFKKHIEDFNTYSADPFVTEESAVEFEANISAHSRVLKRVHELAGEKEAPEIKILENLVAEKSKEHYRGKDTEKKSPANTNQSLDKHAADVQNIIIRVENNIEEAKGRPDKARENVIEEVQTILNKAKTDLKEAEDNKKRDKKDEAFSAILKSHRSATEAEVSLKSGLKVEKEKGKNPKRNKSELKNE